MMTMTIKKLIAKNLSWSIILVSHSSFRWVVPSNEYQVVLVFCSLRLLNQNEIQIPVHIFHSEHLHRKIGICHKYSSNFAHYLFRMPTVGMTWKTNTFTGDALFCDVNMMHLAWWWFGFKWIGHTHKRMSFQVDSRYVNIPCLEFKVKHSQSYLCMSYCPNSCLHRQI